MTCREIENSFREAHHAIYNTRCDAMRQARSKEFPPGTRVTWRCGTRTISGVVEEIPTWSDDAVVVRRNGAKTTKKMNAHSLTVAG